jgi:hypothetical protein
MTKPLPTFEVDREGLRKLLIGRRGPGLILHELLSNSWDESVTRVDATFEWLGRGVYIRVEDDCPEGFADLTHAYTLFAESAKKSDAEKRGRFNLGEKLVIALCEQATISTTKGTVDFDKHGRRHSRAKRATGSVFEGTARMTRAEYDAVLGGIWRLLPPEGIVTTLNGEELIGRQPVTEFTAKLPTEFMADNGELRRTIRLTTVRLFEPLPDSGAGIYELGIPVVETGDRFDVDIAQKVPLNFERDNVTAGFLRDVRHVTFEHTHELLSEDEGDASWITAAAEHPKASSEALRALLDLRFGKKRVSRDVQDLEANKIAVSEGYTVVSGPSLPKSVWTNIKKYEDLLLPAGQVTPSPKPYKPGEGNTRTTLPEEKWTDSMRRIADFSIALADRLLGAQVRVEIVNDPQCMNFGATYGRGPANTGLLEFNLRKLGRRWFEVQPWAERQLSLILHELGHHWESDHLSRSYYDALTTLGARCAKLALDEPEFFQAYAIPEGVTA